MDNFDNIELRSEKVRNIIGLIPPVIFRIGILIISVILVVVFIAALVLKYPESVTTNIVIKESIKGQDTIFIAEAQLPYKYLTTVNSTQKVTITIEGYNKDEWGYIRGAIDQIIEEPIIGLDKKNYFAVNIRLIDTGITSLDKKIHLYNNLQGDAVFLISEKTFFNYMLRK